MNVWMNQSVDKKLSYKYYADERAPYVGTPPGVSQREYADSVQRVRVAGYGLFDVDNVEQRHFGRTLSEILNRVALEQYEIVEYKTYEYVVGVGATKCMRLSIWVTWYEKVDVSREVQRRFAETGQLTPDDPNADTQSVIDDVLRVAGKKSRKRARKSGSTACFAEVRHRVSGGRDGAGRGESFGASTGGAGGG
jgi:hypothetical protein